MTQKAGEHMKRYSENDTGWDTKSEILIVSATIVKMLRLSNNHFY